MNQDEPEVLFSADIMRLFGCGVNEIGKLVLSGVVPKPLGKPKGKEKRRWSKSAVYTSLGNEPAPALTLDAVAAMVESKFAEMLGDTPSEEG